MNKPLRIEGHPILPPLAEPTIRFTFNGQELFARPGEMVSSALYAAGISVFGHHHRDHGAQGIFCVNGQCSQCMVQIDGRPMKACMVSVVQDMAVSSCDGAPSLPSDDQRLVLGRPGEHTTQVLVLGGGPAGLCAAIELGRLGIDVLIVDDKHELGGKLTLQTHQFFGSAADCWAGVRGIDIGHILAQEVAQLPSVTTWLNSTAVGIFEDGKVGVISPSGYRLVELETLLVSLGAREKGLFFPGCDLPGVFGAGAFQTLVNRDQVRSSSRLFIIGGGNVGLIAAYHALQAKIDVVGLVEALPEVGGYKVHADKIKRLGVPIWTQHTVINAAPDPTGEQLGQVTIAAIDERFIPQPGTERTFEVDTLLVAVGLNPCDELLQKASQLGLKAYSAGDTAEIAEASAAIFGGRIVGRQMAQEMGFSVEIPKHWPGLAELLRSRPGTVTPYEPQDLDLPVYPLIRCVQEIPCDPCQNSCPEGLISIGDSIINLPRYEGQCLGCGRCVSICPGLAINLVINDYDPEGKKALLMLPFELDLSMLALGQKVKTTDMEGNLVGEGTIIAMRQRPEQDRRHLVLLEVPADQRLEVAGFWVREQTPPLEEQIEIPDGDPVVCRCERVRRDEILAQIRAGVRDMNQLKAISRVGMGGCGGKTCTELVMRLFRAEGIDPAEITPGTIRPLVAEAPLSAFVQGPDCGDADGNRAIAVNGKDNGR